MKKLFHCLILMALITAHIANAQAAIELNRIVAIVNDDVILESQLNNRTELIIKQLKSKDTQIPSRSALRKQILERLILEELQLQMAKRSGITVDDDALNSSLRKMAEDNSLSLSEFRERLLEEGYNYPAFREQLRNEITLNRLRQQFVDQQIQVTEQEIDNELSNMQKGDNNQSYRLSHILISVSEAASPDELQQARQHIEKLRQQLLDGADFAKIAISESDGRQALNGGDLGWRETDKLPSLFVDVVRKMNKGDISDIIRSPSGFHIIRIADIKGSNSHIIEQTQASHILLKKNSLVTDSELRNRLQQIRERAIQGDDFAELARAYSQDTGSAGDGGSLGWVTPGTMVPEFEKAMNALSPGEISDPVKSRFGWHIIKVEQRRKHDNTQEYQRMQANQSIRRRKIEEEMDVWLRRLRDESYIEYLDDSLAGQS